MSTARKAPAKTTTPDSTETDDTTDGAADGATDGTPAATGDTASSDDTAGSPVTDIADHVRAASQPPLAAPLTPVVGVAGRVGGPTGEPLVPAVTLIPPSAQHLRFVDDDGKPVTLDKVVRKDSDGVYRATAAIHEEFDLPGVYREPQDGCAPRTGKRLYLPAGAVVTEADLDNANQLLAERAGTDEKAG